MRTTKRIYRPVGFISSHFVAADQTHAIDIKGNRRFFDRLIDVISRQNKLYNYIYKERERERVWLLLMVKLLSKIFSFRMPSAGALLCVRLSCALSRLSFRLSLPAQHHSIILSPLDLVSFFGYSIEGKI